MTFTYLPFEPCFIADAIKLWEQTEGLGCSSADSPENLALFLNRNPTTSFVVTVNDNVIATLLCGHDGRRGYMHHLAVADNYRQAGIGKTLLNKALGALKAEGIHKCHAFVFKQNKNRQLFWDHQDWQCRDDLVVYSATHD